MSVMNRGNGYNIDYVMVTDCGPYDFCSSGVQGEMTSAGWNALGGGGGSMSVYYYW